MPGLRQNPLVEGQLAAQAELHGISTDEVLQTVLLRESAIKRLVEPGEVAELVGYLCGPQAGFISGSSFTMDGGWTAR